MSTTLVNQMCGTRAKTGRFLILSALAAFFVWILFLAGVARGDMSGSVFVTVEIGDSITDVDKDTISDLWEMQQFSSLTTATASTDFDKDKFPDLNEYLAGTDPKDPESLLRIERLEVLSPGQLRITWQSTTNDVPFIRRYDIYHADSIEEVCDGGTPLQTRVTTEGETTDVQDSTIDHEHRFYRVRLHR